MGSTPKVFRFPGPFIFHSKHLNAHLGIIGNIYTFYPVLWPTTKAEVLSTYTFVPRKFVGPQSMCVTETAYS